MARRKGKKEEHIDETWLIPYADMLTLLLALFIVLFAASTVDNEKFEQLSQTMSEVFMGGQSVMDYTSAVPPVNIPQEDTQKNIVDIDEGRDKGENDGDGNEPDSEQDEQELTDLERAIQEEMLALEEIQKIIDAYIRDNNLEMSLQTSLTEDGLLITILNNVLFESGSAALQLEARELAAEISELLVTDPPRHATIGGHTDNVPINTAQFRDNWELGSARAISFKRLLLDNPELEPHRFSANTYGQYRPVATNETAEGRAQNRRVEVLILPTYIAGDTR